MRTFLLCWVLSLNLMPPPANAQIMSVGGSAGQSCFQHAVARRRDPQAIAECTAALDQTMTGGDRAGTFVNRGILYMLAGDEDRAVRDYDQAIQLDPSQAEAWLNKAVAMVNSGKGSNAIDLADHSLQLRTQKPALAYYVRGLGHEEVGQTVAAYNDLRKAETLDPKWIEPSEQLKRYHVAKQ